MRHAILLHSGNILTQGRRADLGHVARQMTDIMQKMLHSGFSPGPKRLEWAPAVDICELEDRYEIIVELAGVRREEIEVYTENRKLTVAGNRQDPTPEAKVCLHQMEIEQGPFRRTVTLPPDADEEAVSARYRDGFLRVQVPKRK
jgi:HSP20 family molecular chaperone IbpA